MTKCVPVTQRQLFTAKLMAWFAKAMRPLPWRKTYLPYEVWLSEIMLQQTQAERGAEYFRAWVKRFPDIRSVAEASEEAIMAAWEGLGYYSRARNLHAAAKQIMAFHQGRFPNSVEAIRALPGVGVYTAGAIAAIAFNFPEPAVDANVLRIFARILDIDRPVTEAAVRKLITECVRSLVPADSPRDFCQALMELGALVCGKTPRCNACPVAEFCEARRLCTQSNRPLPGIKKRYAFREVAAAIVYCDCRVYIRKRPSTGLWAGMWEFPCGPVSSGEKPERAAEHHAAEATGLAVRRGKKIATVRHSFTTNRVIMHGYRFDCQADGAEPIAPDGGDGRWVTQDELRAYSFPAGHRKLLEHLGIKTHPGRVA